MCFNLWNACPCLLTEETIQSLSSQTPASTPRGRRSCKACQKKPHPSSAKSRYLISTAVGSHRSASGQTTMGRNGGGGTGRRSLLELGYSTRSSCPVSCTHSGEWNDGCGPHLTLLARTSSKHSDTAGALYEDAFARNDLHFGQRDYEVQNCTVRMRMHISVMGCPVGQGPA